MRHPLCISAASAALVLTACGQGAETASGDAAAPAGPAAAEAEDHDEAEEIIEARQALMIQMRIMMLPMDKARLDEPFDLRDARRNAEVISTTMMAVPLLYPEGTDTASTPHGDARSLALPALWERKDAFEQMAERTAGLAYTMVLIDNEEIFRERAAELRESCNACHAMFQEGYE